jgi:DNA-binding winged helix-turn-helix (wHTH) protein
MPRYRFADYVLSPRRRVLVRGGVEQPLIPRYFDLLVFLIAHRHEAVHRRDIFDRVWTDVVVSDSALSQAIRTIRRMLDDDSKDPRFIRTVSRHGYQFVFDAVIEEEDDGAWPATPPNEEAGVAVVPPAVAAAPRAEVRSVDPFEPLLVRLTAESAPGDDEDRREAAELLHQLGTSEALARLGVRPGHAQARALLRDARWDVPGAGPVPILAAPGAIRAAGALVALRLRRAARIAAGRGVAAAVGGGTAGVVAGLLGGWLLAAVPGSSAPAALAGVLAAIGGCCGALGGAGVGAGISIAEVVALSRRPVGLVVGSAAGGGLVGGLAQWLAQGALATLVGVHAPMSGALAGLVIGGAAGLGYAVATRGTEGGLAAPRGRQRTVAVAWIAGATALAALALTLNGRPLVGGTIHKIAQSSNGSQAALTPLGRLVGEPDFGPLSRALLGTGEGLLFGLGLGIGLTRGRRG